MRGGWPSLQLPPVSTQQWVGRKYDDVRRDTDGTFIRFCLASALLLVLTFLWNDSSRILDIKSHVQWQTYNLASDFCNFFNARVGGPPPNLSQDKWWQKLRVWNKSASRRPLNAPIVRSSGTDSFHFRERPFVSSYRSNFVHIYWKTRSFWWITTQQSSYSPPSLFRYVEEKAAGRCSVAPSALSFNQPVVRSTDFDFVASASGPNRKIPDCGAVSAPQILRTFNAYKMSIQSTPMSHFSANLAELTLTLGRRVKCHSNQCRWVKFHRIQGAARSENAGFANFGTKYSRLEKGGKQLETEKRLGKRRLLQLLHRRKYSSYQM